MFSTDIAERDIVDSRVHSSGEVELVSPSLLPHSKSSCVQNTRVLKDSSTMLDGNIGRQKEKVRSYPDVEMLNDVEPDGSQLSSCAKPSCYEEKSRPLAIVTVVDSSPVILTSHLSGDKYDQAITDEKQKPPTTSLGLTVLQKGTSLRDSQGISATRQSLSDDVAQVHTDSQNTADDYSEIIGDPVTQSSTADQTFHSCDTMDLDSSLVNMQFAVVYIFFIIYK